VDPSLSCNSHEGDCKGCLADCAAHDHKRLRDLTEEADEEGFLGVKEDEFDVAA
jgi:hypothetical protein